MPGVRGRAARRPRRRSSSEVLELQPPQGLVDKVRTLGKLKSIADSMPKEVSKAPCQEVVLTGDDVDLDVLPIQRCWPLDPAPFITLPAVITKDRATGVRNVGMYRMQKIDRRSTFMHWQIHKDGRADLRAAPDGRIPVAVALGLDPVTAYSASAPLPKHVGELMVAGFLKGSAVQLVQVQDRRPRGAGERRDRARGLGRPRRRRASRARSATTRASTRRPRSSRSSASPRSRCAATRSTRRSSSASRRPRTSGSRRRPSASSCRRSG